MIKLVVADIDDTLVNDDLEITEENRQAIRRLHDNGILFTLATGRMYKSALPFAKELMLDERVPMIAYNGALIKRVNGEMLRHSPIAPELACEIAEYCRVRGWTLNAYYEDELYVAEMNENVRYYQALAKVNVHVLDDIKEFIQDGAKELSKLLIIGSVEEIGKWINQVEQDFGSRTQAVRSKERYIEITSLEATKGAALKWLAGSLGIKQEEVMAIGDSGNDVDMIKYAGIGVAMGNAKSVAKDAADYVTVSNGESGVAKAIERHVNT